MKPIRDTRFTFTQLQNSHKIPKNIATMLLLSPVKTTMLISYGILFDWLLPCFSKNSKLARILQDFEIIWKGVLFFRQKKHFGLESYMNLNNLAKTYFYLKLRSKKYSRITIVNQFINFIYIVFSPLIISTKLVLNVLSVEVALGEAIFVFQLFF